MKPLTFRYVSLLILAAVVASAQVQLPEMNFPSANESHQSPIKVQRICGIILDENDAVIPNAQVEVRKRKGLQALEVMKGVSDSTGRFQFDVPKGTYDVDFRREGFANKNGNRNSRK